MFSSQGSSWSPYWKQAPIDSVFYEVEFYTTNEKWYKYEIDVLSGSIVKWEYDAEKYAVWKEMNQSLEGVKTSALKMAGLSADNNVLWGEIEQDYEDGQLIYEGKFYYNAMEYEFEINADGVVIDWEVESIYDWYKKRIK